MFIKILRNNNFKILTIILLSILIDILFIFQINNPPEWDQGYHLTNVFKMYNILDNGNINLLNKIDPLLDITNSYRGPLTYLLSSIFIKIFNNSYFYSYLSNQIFNVICILSIYKISTIYKNQSVGIWASIIFTFSPLVLIQRSNYLIDLSLTSFITLSLLFLTKWYLNEKNRLISIISSGISLGLVFLTKPTGIIFLVFPILIIFIKLFKSKKNYLFTLNEIIIFIFTFLIIIFPWFSRHWITIISSIINAWNWGVNYQDGFESLTLESWLYYIRKLPLVFGIINSSIFLILFTVEKIYPTNVLEIKLKVFNKLNLWFLSYILNCYIVLSLMSTKDIRFFLPLYPLFCIYLSIFIHSKKTKFFSPKIKKFILVTSISISIIFPNNSFIFTKNKDKYFSNWPHSDVINQITQESPYLSSTLAMLPDTKEVNTFNLEAEAARQGEFVAVRQIVSNMDSYKDDLKYFDWFLVKTKNQGIMTNKSKQLLNKYLLENNSFVIHKKWSLPDKSDLILLRRQKISSKLTQIECLNKSKNLNITQIGNGISLTISGDGKFLKSAIILVDFIGEEFKKLVNISIANGAFHRSFDEGKCYTIRQNISLDFPEDISKSLFLKARLINNSGEIKSLNLEKDYLIVNEKFIKSNNIEMANRITKIKYLGDFLKKGQFKNLFNLVGIINQSDPKQQYLQDAERTYLQRYEDDNNIDDLYSILISQILQRKVVESEKTINLILESDYKNGNAYLAKSIIEIYLLNRKNARISLNKAKSLNKSSESEEILKPIEGLIDLLEMRFIKAYKTFI